MSSPSRRKTGCVFDPDDHIQISGCASVSSGISLTSQPNPLPIARAGLNTHLHRIGPAYRPFAVARRTAGNVLAGSLATRTRHIKLHPPARLRDLAGAIAFRTFPRRFNVALAVTVGAGILPRNVEPHYTAADRGPERHIHLIFEVRTCLRTSFSG